MKRNKKNSSNSAKTLHVGRAATERGKGSRTSLFLNTAGILLALVLLVGIFIGFQKLYHLWIEQCEIHNEKEQITVEGLHWVPRDVLLNRLSMTNGANFALLDLRHEREIALKRIPSLRSISMTRRMPNKLHLSVEEREPIAQITSTKTDRMGVVADTDGYIFMRMKGADLLPMVKVLAVPSQGERLGTRARAALEVIAAGLRNEVPDTVRVLQIDARKEDHLVLILRDNHQRVKLAWQGMGSDDPVSHETLVKTLQNLAQAINSNVANRAVGWIALSPEEIIADTKEPIQ